MAPGSRACLRSWASLRRDAASMTRTEVLSDEMWARIEPVLPRVKGPMGRPMREHRPLVEGAIYRYRTGIAWRDLPAEFGPWQTVWRRHHLFSTDGTWDKVHVASCQDARLRVFVASRVAVSYTH